MHERIREILEKLSQELAANKRKAVIMGVLLLVLIFAVGRVFWTRTVPATAEALVPPPMAAVPPADPKMPLVRPVPQASVPQAAAAQTATGKPVAASTAGSASVERGNAGGGAATAVSVANLPRTLERDIFTTPSWSQFPREGSSAAEDDRSGESSGPSILEKMRDVLSERRERRSRNLDQIAGELAALKLQSTMSGPMPTAYISGRLVHEGDTISGFSVVRIQEKCVKLRKRGITLPLIMP
jgi:hypothetical protein